MTDDERALLAAVAAAPADDAPRLVYADWLDEHARPVPAEFIRVQVEIARLADAPQPVRNAHVGLWKRERELLDAHADELLGPLAGLSPDRDAEFRRGFLHSIRLPVGPFMSLGKRITALLPQPAEIRVTGAAERFTDLFLSTPDRVLDSVTALDLGSSEFDTAEYITELDDGVTIASAAEWSRLRSLSLEGASLGDEGLRRFAAAARFPVLDELDLSGNELTDAGVIALLDTPLPARLRRLVLGGNPIGDPAAVELADRWPRSGRLENLNLRFTNIGPDGWLALTARFGGVADLF